MNAFISERNLNTERLRRFYRNPFRCSNEVSCSFNISTDLKNLLPTYSISQLMFSIETCASIQIFFRLNLTYGNLYFWGILNYKRAKFFDLLWWASFYSDQYENVSEVSRYAKFIVKNAEKFFEVLKSRMSKFQDYGEITLTTLYEVCAKMFKFSTTDEDAERETIQFG